MKSIILSVAAFAAMTMAACGSTEKAADNAAEATEAGVDEITVVEEAVVEVEPGDSITSTPELLTVIDFNAEWCGPCQQFKPVFHQVAAEYAGKAAFLSVNVDSCPDIAAKFNVTSIPQITVVTPAGDVTSQVGSMPVDDFRALVKNALGEE